MSAKRRRQAHVSRQPTANRKPNTHTIITSFDVVSSQMTGRDVKNAPLGLFCFWKVFLSFEAFLDLSAKPDVPKTTTVRLRYQGYHQTVRRNQTRSACDPHPPPLPRPYTKDPNLRDQDSTKETKRNWYGSPPINKKDTWPLAAKKEREFARRACRKGNASSKTSGTKIAPFLVCNIPDCTLQSPRTQGKTGGVKLC